MWTKHSFARTCMQQKIWIGISAWVSLGTLSGSIDGNMQG